MANGKQEVVLRERLIGVKHLAAELGVSRMWIWRVRTGQARSPRVEKALKRYGIEIRG